MFALFSNTLRVSSKENFRNKENLDSSRWTHKYLKMLQLYKKNPIIISLSVK